MDTKQPLSLFLVAILVASVFTVVGLSSLPVQRASAQAVTIETSADELGGTFFGRGVLQVVIEDSNADDDDPDTISVDIEADGETSDDDSFDIADTNDGSQRFEFFLVHEDSSFAGGVGIDPINSRVDVPGDFVLGGDAAPGDGATIISFGATGNLTTGGGLYGEDAPVSFTITYGNQEVTIDFEEADAGLELDRDLYGSESTVYTRIIDQDANVNPTDRDFFTITDVEMNDELFGVQGGDYDTDIFFEETGDNTGVFEAEVILGTNFTATEDTVELTLNDQAEYDTAFADINEVDINDSTETSDFDFEISDEEGDIDDVTDLTFAGELKVLVRDSDQNKDSEDEDDIPAALTVTVDDGLPDFDEETLDLTETGDDTGVFEIDASNGEMRITFCDDDETGPCPDPGNGILELRGEEIEDIDITIDYTDPLPDGAANPVASFIVNMDTTPGQISAPEEVGIIDEFTATVTDPDLNDSPRTRDSYQWNLTGTSPFPLTRAGLNYSDIYELEIELDGEPLEYPDPDFVLITMRETGVNTGIFEFEIDVEEDISDVAEVEGDPVGISDGDDIELTINDAMSDFDDADEDSVSITIGKPNVGIDFDRTDVPIPPELGADALDADVGLGGDVIVSLIVIDPTLGDSTTTVDFPDFVIGDGPGEFQIEVDGDDVDSCTLDATVGVGGADNDALDDCDLNGATTLDDILDIDATLEETGKNTNVFEADLTFSGIDPEDLAASDWQDMEITITYTSVSDADEDDTAGFTFRGSDGIVTVDQPSAKAGTVITVTVEDQDLNLDTSEVESFESSIGTDDPFLVSLETEDDDIENDGTETFEETGEDTGVFEAEFEVGDDILVVSEDGDDQASNILISYNDEIDSTGGSGDELEVNVPIVSATGSIQVTPELVGPATTLTVLIIDSDLDEDASSTNEYTEEDLDGRVEFSSSRNEVNEAGPDIEETGPNTGVFMFELELITDAEACAEDDLDSPDFDGTAEGGDTDSSIGACPGDLIAIRYEDEKTGSGGGATVSEVIEVMSWDPEFVADQESYGIGDRVTVSISDPDANRDPDIADSLTDIRVTSDSDQVGEEISAIETGKDTGVFRLQFGTTSGTAGGSISVKTGDDITVRYTDEFPADFVDEEEDKDFEFVIPVGGGGDIGTTQVTTPELQDVTGREIDELSAGQQVVLATSVRNNEASPTAFVALIEVRDSSGVTVFLAWQTGTLPANGQTNVGLSWTPEDSGDYTVRTFVISDLNNPRVLSAVSESDITVN